MKSNYMSEGELTCSECGREFYVLCKPNWTYRIVSKITSKYTYQCSFTCYDHACLRLSKDSGMDPKVREAKIKSCEDVMRAQGKTILHPRFSNEK